MGKVYTPPPGYAGELTSLQLSGGERGGFDVVLPSQKRFSWADAAGCSFYHSSMRDLSQSLYSEESLLGAFIVTPPFSPAIQPKNWGLLRTFTRMSA